MGQIEQNHILTLYWIIEIELFLHLIKGKQKTVFKQMTVCKQNYVLMLEWILWKRSVFTFNYVFVLDVIETIKLSEKMSPGLFKNITHIFSIYV